MIPSQVERSQFTNLTGEKVEMGFDRNAMKHLMSMLAGLYADRIMAMIREYSTNARDAHIDAGCPERPIEVTTPTTLQPFLVIKDFGVGLSVADIHNLYSKYGASTKRDSNAAAGMFGVGSKSALAYTSQFTVTAVKDGVKVLVAVSKDEDGGGSMTIVDTSATTEPNGVEVRIPARGTDIHAFQEKAAKLFSYWEKGTVLVDGKQPASYLDNERDYITVDDDLIVRRNEGYYDGVDSVIIMGNVPYPAGEKLRSEALGLPYRHTVVVRVPIGTVEPAPSREALMDTKQTENALEAIAARVKAKIEGAVQREIDGAKTAADAVQAVLRWKKLLNSGGTREFVWKGQKLPSQISPPDGGRMLLTASAYSRYASYSTVRAVDLDYLDKHVWVTGYTPRQLTVTHKKKMLMWKEDRRSKNADFVCNGFILVDFPLDTTWIPKDRIVKWEDVAAYKLPNNRVKSGSTSTRLPGSYAFIEKKAGADRGTGRYGVAGSEINMRAPVFYLHGNVQKGYFYSAMFDHLQAYTIICLPANRIDKFKRDNPNIKSVDAEVEAQYKAWSAKLTKDQKTAMQISDECLSNKLLAYATVVDQLKDPAVKEAVRLAKIDVTGLMHQRRTYERHLRKSIPCDASFVDPLLKYPLIYRSCHSPDAHTVAYMNACYEGGW